MSWLVPTSIMKASSQLGRILCLIEDISCDLKYWWPVSGKLFTWSHAGMTWWRHQMETFSPHKGQWHGALMFSLICAWRNAWVNNREAGDLRLHRAHYDVTVMTYASDNIGRPPAIAMSLVVYLSACLSLFLFLSADNSHGPIKRFVATNCYFEHGSASQHS